jgi:hypothetical protein
MSRERWVYLKDGQLMMHEENDGWSFLKQGPQSGDWPVTLDEVRSQYPNHYEEARKLLKEAENP